MDFSSPARLKRARIAGLGHPSTGLFMQLQVNGDMLEFAAPLTAAALLQHLGLENQRIALELNAEIVPRSRFLSTTLQAGDRVEIVRAIGGG